MKEDFPKKSWEQTTHLYKDNFLDIDKKKKKQL